MIELTHGEGRYSIRLRALETGGNGLVVFLTGGEKPHLGGVSLAAPPYAGASELSHCDTWDLTLPGHKDKELARSIARQIFLAVGEPVSVNVGIHIDNASEEEIQHLNLLAEDIAKQFITQYKVIKRRYENV
ncbi:MAG: hypothetical protein IJT92_04895 [Spirochaetia bacterium]|nr:hypothetical protein [Spirochaetia bacterium]MBR3671805.1 hypothetical protein [Spirochaetia bacterium]